MLKKEPAAQQMQDQGKLDQVSQLVLADEITHKIAEYAGQRENITVDETKVCDAVQENGGPEAAVEAERAGRPDHDPTAVSATC